MTDLNRMKCKYIILNVDISGLGNRLMTVLTYFLIALLIDRVILIYSEEYSWNEIFCESFINSSWIFPTTIDYNEYRKVLKKSNSLKSLTNPIYLYTSRNLSNIDSYYGVSHIWNIVHGQQYWLTLLYANPYYPDLHYFAPGSLTVSLHIHSLITYYTLRMIYGWI